MPNLWTREEEILAFALYCETPFGKMHAQNPDIIDLAQKIGRTPASVSMKMCNFGRFDPELRARGIAGLSNGSKLDEQIWNEFHSDWEALLDERAQILNVAERPLPPGETREQVVNMRANQDFFRRTLMSAYGGSCCITGITIPDLLIASHIKPWHVSDPKTERTAPSNGLLLNAFHDRAFDKGYITVDTKFRVKVSPRINTLDMTPFTKAWLFDIDGLKIRLPEKFAPEKQFLEYHNDMIFLH